jgi:hypothetical protein
MTAARRQRKGGFTLVEIALATVLVTVGVLSLFWVITTSLENSRLAMADTQSAMFAQSVFAGLRAQSVKSAQSGSANWSQYWTDIMGGNTGVTVASGETWSGPKKSAMMVSNGIGSLPFMNYSTRQKKELDIMNHALTYELTVKPVSRTTKANITVAGNSDPIPIQLTTTNITVQLKVWDGLYSSMDTNKAVIYYSEFSDPGDL